MKPNLGEEFKKAEMLGLQAIIECEGHPSKTLIDAANYVVRKLSANVKISLESKSASDILLENIIFKKYES